MDGVGWVTCEGGRWTHEQNELHATLTRAADCLNGHAQAVRPAVACHCCRSRATLVSTSVACPILHARGARVSWLGSGRSRIQPLRSGRTGCSQSPHLHRRPGGGWAVGRVAGQAFRIPQPCRRSVMPPCCSAAVPPSVSLGLTHAPSNLGVSHQGRSPSGSAAHKTRRGVR